MSHNDDPPFLTIGTEVSAKYRGAFCEATIKVAKKLVKCKVSYSKGQTVVVSNDVIKGTLKVGNQVEVRQSDSQYKLATILKLTDQSTYTVVFDDGDERTLKRSSLCLKGARHYHESESLDNTPLTDPENFGTPVMQSSKKTRNNKRRRLSHSPTREEEISKKKCCYPPEFPVGKVVFLENDRRRSCWLPAVVVPAHYVMEESDMTPDAICIRSFKDGRFFASTKNELHDFAPDKEPLLSMLEGEIQAMYRSKPAIERAMTYLNTGGLPWDMDLFTSRNDEVFPCTQTPSPPRPPPPRPPTPKKEEVKEREEESTTEKNAFMEKLKKLHESKGAPLTRQPTLGHKDLNLFKLYRLVMENGGMEKVTQDLKWRSLYLQLGMPPMSNASYTIKQAYKKYLLAFELSEKTKSKTPPPPPPLPPVVKDSPSRSNRRRTVSDEEHNRQQEKVEKAAKITRQTSKDASVREPLKNTMKREKVEREKAEQQREKAEQQREKAEQQREKAEQQREKAEQQQEEVKREKVEQQTKIQERLEPTVNHDVKSETSDPESSQMDSGSSNGDDMEDQKLERRGLEQCVAGYKENDKILVWYGKGKTLRTYEAKILGIEENESQRDYLVHYNGWNTRYDEWIEGQRIAGRLTGPSKGFTRPVYKKKSKKAKQLPPPPPDGGGTGSAKGREKKESKKTTHSSSGKPPATTTTSSPSVSVPDTTSSESGSTNSNSSSNSSSGSGKGGTPATRGPGRPPKRRKSSAPTDGSGNESPFSPPSMPKLPKLSLPTTTTNTNTTITPNATATTVNKKTSAPSPKTEIPSLPSPPPVPKVEPSRTNLVPEKEMEMETDEAIEVKREENFSWSPGDANSADPLVCSERLSDVLKLNVKPNPDQQPRSPTPSKSQDDSSSPPVSPKQHSSTEDSLKLPIDQPAASPPSPPPTHVNNNNSDLSSSPTHTSSACLEDGDQEDRMEVDEKSSDEKSSRTESPSPPPNEQQSHVKGSPLLEGKRRLREFETEEEYEERKKARRANMNYVINFGQLPDMTSGERVALIQERIRDVEKRWIELKNEVASLDRKRRRARRKEREASRSQANQSITTANTNSHLQSPTIECH